MRSIMKIIRRLALVLALTIGASACSTNIMAPDTDDDTPHLPGGNSHNPGGNS